MMVIEKPQEVRVRPHDFAAPWFSITILECDFSNPALGNGFREGKTRWNRASGRVRWFFLRCYRNPKVDDGCAGPLRSASSSQQAPKCLAGRAARNGVDELDLSRHLE